MAHLSLKNVKKTYGKVPVIHGVTLDVDDGELIVIVGPSGCGKSTLLRMIAGLENITAGTVAIGDRIVNDLEPRERDIAMVFQNYALYPHMTVFANMAYSLKIAGVKRREIVERVGVAARLLELEPYLERKPRALSGGQRQRVAMGRAIIRNPAVFLFDEPLSNLDARLRVQMRMEIKMLQRRLGVTSLYVTHDQAEAMTLADRMVVMNDGVVEQVGAPLEIYQHPASVFVAGFIGSPPMNFFTARKENGMVYPCGGDGQPIGKVKVGIRPEHLHLCPPGAGIFNARITFCEELGAETHIHLEGEGGTHFIARWEQEGTTLEPGKAVGIQVDDGRLTFFDAAGKSMVTG
jgi:sn-glycerol 3-phosphate transport system ATP-binding protein